MEMEEFRNLKVYVDPDYKHINSYILDAGEIFYVEPNFYTQLRYCKEHFEKQYSEIIEKIIDIAKRNKKVIFTGNFDSPVVFKDDFIYREINDVLAELKLYFDNKCNPESDWKD
jgi:hypothetical protein